MEATWCPRGCSPYPADAGGCPAPESIPFRVGPGGAPPFDKAGTHKNGSGVDRGIPDDAIEVSGAWWKGLTRAQRCAVLAHEHAHSACNMTCEDCSDRHGGFLMRAWGFTQDAIRAAFDSLVHVGERLGAGARAVEGALAHDAKATTSPAPGFDSTFQVDGAGFDSSSIRMAAAAPPPATQSPPPATQRAVPPPNLGTKAPSPSTAGTSTIQPLQPFNPSTPGDPFTAELDALFTDSKVDPVIVRSEVLAGLFVAFLVFVVFRWGGK